MSETIAVIIPAFNAETTIDRALRSVLDQLCPVRQVIVVDDASIDTTCSRLRAWEHRLPLHVVRHAANRGIAQSLMDGISHAKSSLIFRLDADDEWLPSHVENILSLARNTPEAILFSGRAQYIDKLGNVLRASKSISDANVRRLLMWDNPIVHSAVAFRKTAFDAVGGYEIGVIWEDYRLWIRLAARGLVCGSDELSVKYHVNSQSLSRIVKARSLTDRRRCQVLALRNFYKKHPITALASALVLSARFLINS